MVLGAYVTRGRWWAHKLARFYEKRSHKGSIKSLAAMALFHQHSKFDVHIAHAGKDAAPPLQRCVRNTGLNTSI